MMLALSRHWDWRCPDSIPIFRSFFFFLRHGALFVLVISIRVSSYCSTANTTKDTIRIEPCVSHNRLILNLFTIQENSKLPQRENTGSKYYFQVKDATHLSFIKKSELESDTRYKFLVFHRRYKTFLVLKLSPCNQISTRRLS